MRPFSRLFAQVYIAQFGCYGVMLNYLAGSPKCAVCARALLTSACLHDSVWKLTHASGPPAPLTHHLVAGTVAGAQCSQSRVVPISKRCYPGTASTLITTPTDLVKIRMMTQQQQQRTNPSAGCIQRIAFGTVCARLQKSRIATRYTALHLC